MCGSVTWSDTFEASSWYIWELIFENFFVNKAMGEMSGKASSTAICMMQMAWTCFRCHSTEYLLSWWSQATSLPNIWWQCSFVDNWFSEYTDFVKGCWIMNQLYWTRVLIESHVFLHQSTRGDACWTWLGSWIPGLCTESWEMLPPKVFRLDMWKRRCEGVTCLARYFRMAGKDHARI